MKSVKNKVPVLTVAPVVLALGLVIALSTSHAEGPNDILVIANKSVKAGKISADELKAIFLKKKESFGGGRVVPINAKDGSALRKAFQQRLVEMGGDQEKSYWEEQKIKSGLAPPPEFATTLKAVFSVKGSIGYCFRSEYRDGVANILLVL